ncbi:MAG: family 1 glycosylhydrolase [candidate division Zixibacteria bacterium]|nr:family 1 glycosylhydrolase [candidate division Zixibacteria bacterium]
MESMKQSNYNGFLWGAATSAFQIEGQVETDMTDWERRGKFRADGKDPRVGDAADHWRRWEEDFRLLRDLGVNSYRFSVEWARIEPEPGIYNQSALDQYGRMIDRLLEYGITPMVTLHHFTHPCWFQERSPWHHTRAIECYLRFVNKLSRCLLDRVPLVITLNEPLVWTLAAYGAGKFPPGEKNLRHLMTAFTNMLRAHREAYDLIKHNHPDTQVGIAHNFIAFKRAPSGIEMDRKVKRLIHHFYNSMILEAFRDNRVKVSFPLMLSYDAPIALDDKIDFWGVNYYYRLHVRFRLSIRQPFELLSLVRSSGEGKSDLGWEIYSRGLKKVCRWLASTGKPIYITENGIAAQDDSLRLRFIASHLEMLDEILREGHPVKGYYHWSLLDNYEWLEGTKARFGLYHVDFDNGYGRTLKPSGGFYRDHIKKHSVYLPATE